MWPSKPLHVAYNEPFLLCFCDRGIDVFDVKSGEWIQIIQFEKVFSPPSIISIISNVADSKNVIDIQILITINPPPLR